MKPCIFILFAFCIGVASIAQNNTVDYEKYKLSDSLYKKPVFSNLNYDYLKSLKGMCKMEWQVEKKICIPVRFRVGNIEQSDFLEGKSNSSWQSVK